MLIIIIMLIIKIIMIITNFIFQNLKKARLLLKQKEKEEGKT